MYIYILIYINIYRYIYRYIKKQEQKGSILVEKLEENLQTLCKTNAFISISLYTYGGSAASSFIPFIVFGINT